MNLNIPIGSEKPERIFQNIESDQGVISVESLCMNCFKNGMSKFLLTRIPHFRDIIISSFECEKCGFKNNEVQSANAICEQGETITCLVNNCDDLKRQVVVSEHASIGIRELSLEIPPSHKKGYLNTIEGILLSMVSDLSSGQEERKKSDEISYEKINTVIDNIKKITESESKCNFYVDDPSGNSYIENFNIPKTDPKLKSIFYRQTKENLEAMGLSVDPTRDNDIENEIIHDDSIYCFNTNCSSCASPTETRMHLIDIPHFREVIIMATTCEYCGFRTNEVKSSGAITPTGKKITLKITSEEDLSRDILKSESCCLEIPEIELQITTGSLGGRFTTLEGLLTQVKKELVDKAPFSSGDSATTEQKNVFKTLLDNIDLICTGKLKCSVILDDPLSNSYIQNIYAPDVDPNLSIEVYERTFDQNEDFGINDMVTEGYEKEGEQ